MTGLTDPRPAVGRHQNGRAYGTRTRSDFRNAGGARTRKVSGLKDRRLYRFAHCAKLGFQVLSPPKLLRCSSGVTVSAPDFALGDLGRDRLPRVLGSHKRCDTHPLPASHVIEVENHRVGLAAVHTGISAQVSHDVLVQLVAPCPSPYDGFRLVRLDVCLVVLALVRTIADLAIGLNLARTLASKGIERKNAFALSALTCRTSYRALVGGPPSVCRACAQYSLCRTDFRSGSWIRTSACPACEAGEDDRSSVPQCRPEVSIPVNPG